MKKKKHLFLWSRLPGSATSPTEITHQQQKRAGVWKTKTNVNLTWVECIFFTEFWFGSVRLSWDASSRKKMINIFIVFRLPSSVSLLFLIPFAFVRTHTFVRKCAISTTSQFGEKPNFFFSSLFRFCFNFIWCVFLLRAFDGSQNFIRFSHPFGVGPLFSASPCIYCLRFDRSATGMHVRIVSARRFQ